MLQRTHLEATYSAEQLIEAGLRKYAAVVTEDDDSFGVAMRFHMRPASNVDPLLKLFACYLEVQTVELGGTAFIPLEVVSGMDPAEQRLHLEVTLATVKNEVWNRKLDFIARGLSTRMELPTL